ncbi:YajG family lipoprotein [Rhodanobacter sp. UC4437_H4]
MSKIYKLAGLSLIAASTLSGCMFHAQTVHLQPQVQYVDSNEGRGLPITIIVKDERPTQDLGHRGNGVASAATITSDSDIASVVKQHLVEGFTHRGFKVVDSADSSEEVVTVRVRALETELHQGFWTGHQEANGAAQLTVVKNGRTYENFYRVDSKQSKFWVPTAGQNSEYINGALSNLIGKIINDDKLVSFMAS